MNRGPWAWKERRRAIEVGHVECTKALEVLPWIHAAGVTCFTSHVKPSWFPSAHREKKLPRRSQWGCPWATATRSGGIDRKFRRGMKGTFSWTNPGVKGTPSKGLAERPRTERARMPLGKRPNLCDRRS